METQRTKVASLKKNRERVLVAVRLEESSVASERNTASSSPLFDDFDDDLCFELEEVGKELDRYKEEASHSPDLDEVLPPGMMPREGSPSSTTSGSWLTTPSPPISPFPVCMQEDTTKQRPLEAHSPTCIGATELRGTGARADLHEAVQASTTTVGHISSSAAEKSEDEYDCQVKALNSLRVSLVVKVKMLVTHKKNLSLQKDLLLENFDGDKSKLIENLLENVSQSKQIDGHIQSLNKQISMTNKKIVDLKKSGTVMNDDTEKEQHSKVNRALHDKGEKMSEYSKISLPNSECETSPGKGVRKTSLEGKSATQNSKSDVRNNTFHLGHEFSLPKSVKLSEVQENSACEVMEKLSGQLAIHPTSKNTLWCNTCNLFFVSIKSYLKHLEASEHLDKVKTMGEKSLYKLFSHSTYMPEEKDKDSMQEEAFGVEFLCSAKVVFCSLCECILLTREEAASHAQSLQHTTKYKEYLLNNTGKELAFLKAKMGAFTEYCKRRKVTAMDNKVYVNSSLGRSIVGGSKKKTAELPAMSKRQKMDTDSQA